MTTSHAPGRRGFVQGMLGLTFGFGMAPKASAQEYEPSVTFNDQTSSGDEVKIAEIVTSEPVSWKVHANRTDFAKGTIDGKRRLENKTIELETDIKTSKKVYFSIFPEEGGTALAYDGAIITIENDSIVGVNEIEKDPDVGFNYPYILYVPSTTDEWDERTPLLVEPNNSNLSSDEFSYHKKHARRLIEGQTPRKIADELGVPLLVPIFPGSHAAPVDTTHYIFQLDRDTLKIESGPLERIDNQLLRMIDDAQDRLASNSHPVREEFMMNGFSASGNFVDRFTMLHPERVLSVTAGGVNGMNILPRKEAKGHTLNYHVGIADVEEITGISVDFEALDAVNQFYYMGAEDDNDTIGYENAWTSDELEQTALDVYGEDMIEDRFTYCEKVYEEEGIDAMFKVYENAGHTTRPALDDIIEFHKEAMHDETTETTTSMRETTSTTSPPPTRTSDSTSTSTATSTQTETKTTSTVTLTQETTRTTSPGFGVGTLFGAFSGTGLGYSFYNRLLSDDSSDSSN